MPPAVLDDLAMSEFDPARVVEETIDFLLDREPATSLPDEISIKTPTAEWLAASEAARTALAAAALPAVEGELPTSVEEGPSGEPAPLDEILPDLAADEKPTEKVKASKTAGKKLKKVLKEVKALGEDVDVEIEEAKK